MPLAQVNGTELYYEDTGKGSALLFIHGTGASAGIWDSQVQRLGDRYRCVTYDRRGNRRSGPSNAPRSIGADADDAAELIQRLGMAPCLVVGLSWGGAIAVALGRQHPELVRGLALGEPTLLGLDMEGAGRLGAMKPEMEKAAAAGGPRAAVDAFYGLACAQFWATLDEAGREPFRANFAGMFEDLQMPPYILAEADLSSIQTPALLLVGTDSAPFFRRVAELMCVRMPRAKLLQVSGSGHVVFAEKPDFCAQAIADFELRLPA